jgi:hypothetical protein
MRIAPSVIGAMAPGAALKLPLAVKRGGIDVLR